MRRFEDCINSLIKSVKKRQALKDIVFLSAFSAKHTEHPLNRFLAVVNIPDAKKEHFVGDSELSLVTGTVEIRLYAPRETDGTELFRLCAELIDALMSEGETMIEDTSVSEIRYDSAIRSVYRQVEFSLRITEEVVG